MFKILYAITNFLKIFLKIEKVETRASGIQGADFDEIYGELMGIGERMEEAKLICSNIDDKSRDKENDEKGKADDIRKIVTERFNETKKRKEEDGKEVTPKRDTKYLEAMALVEQGLKIEEENAKMEREMR